MATATNASPEAIRRCVRCGAKLASSNTTKKCFRHHDMEKLKPEPSKQEVRKMQPLVLKPLPPLPVATHVSGVAVPLKTRIISAVCRYYKLRKEELTGRRRFVYLTGPRTIAAYLLREDAGLSQEAIGKSLGGRDHTMAYHAFKKVEANLLDWKGDIEAIRALYREP